MLAIGIVYVLHSRAIAKSVCLAQCRALLPLPSFVHFVCLLAVGLAHAQLKLLAKWPSKYLKASFFFGNILNFEQLLLSIN